MSQLVAFHSTRVSHLSRRTGPDYLWVVEAGTALDRSTSCVGTVNIH